MKGKEVCIGECYLALVGGQAVPVRVLRRRIQFRHDSRGRVIEDIIFECRNLQTGRLVERRGAGLYPLTAEDERRFAHLINHIQ